MGKGKVFGTLIRRTEGSVAIISAIGLVAFLGMVSLAIDMGQLYTVRNELQNVADAAVLAAAGNLIHDYGAGAVRDAAAAQQAALTVAQRQSQLAGQSAVGDADRNDVNIIFGAWNIYAGNPSTAWTEIGPTCSSDSNANAVKISIRRASGTVYGPVSTLFGSIMGFNTSQVAATAIAYLGYTTSTPTGSVTVPVALPDTILTAAKQGQTGWWASLSLLAPKEAMASLAESPIFIDDAPSPSVLQMRTMGRRLQAEQKLGLIVVDYLQLIQPKSNYDSMVQQVTEISRALKGLARELNIPVLALSQLSRAVEMAKPAIPKLAHLRESGSIEQDADVVMFIYRKAADRAYSFNELSENEKNLAEIYIAKHRNGPTGRANLYFDQDTVSFKSMEKTGLEEY